MKLRSLAAAIALMAFSFAVTPVSALTLEQAQAEVAGYFCSGSLCVKTSTDTDVKAISVNRRSLTPDVVLMPKAGTYQYIYEWAKDLKWNSIAEKPGTALVEYSFGVCVKKTIVFHPNSSRALSWSVNTDVDKGKCKK